MLAGMLAAAREFLESGRPPAPARDAATVALVRDGAAGLEVYLLRRVAAMSFAPGAYVYPGGAVDPDDRDAEIGWSGATPAEWAATYGTDEPTALALVCAAVRETFEESGVLLAGPSAGEVLADVSGDEWEAEREALEGRGSPSPSSWRGASSCSAPTCCGRSRTGSRPRPSPGASTRGSSSPRCPRASSAATSAARPTAGCGSRPQEALDSGLPLLPPTRSVLFDLARFDDVAVGARRGAPDHAGAAEVRRSSTARSGS